MFLSPRDSADVFLPNTRYEDRGEITSFPKLLPKIGAGNGRKLRRDEKNFLMNAPYVAEFPLHVECRLIQMEEIGGHPLFIGEIMDFMAEEFVPSADRDETILDTEGIPETRRHESGSGRTR